MRAGAHGVVLVAALAAAAAPATALASPEWIVRAGVGGGYGALARGGREQLFRLGLHTALLFGREGPYNFGAGPYAEALAIDFDAYAAGGGLSALLPIDSTFPIVVCAGGFASWTDDAGGPRAGAAARVWWGTHSYNYHRAYTTTAGVFVEGRAELHGGWNLTAGAEVDGYALLYPFLFLYAWAFGS